jgi:hypothetical protein
MMPVVRPDTPRSALFDAAMQQPKECVYGAFDKAIETHTGTITSNYGSFHNAMNATKEKFSQFLMDTGTQKNRFFERQFNYDPSFMSSSPMVDRHGKPVRLLPLEALRENTGGVHIKHHQERSFEVYGLSASRLDQAERQALEWMDAEKYPALLEWQNNVLGVRINDDPTSSVFKQRELYTKQPLPKYTLLGLSGGIKLAAQVEHITDHLTRNIIHDLAGIHPTKYYVDLPMRLPEGGGSIDSSIDLRSIFMMANAPDDDPLKSDIAPFPIYGVDRDTGEEYALWANILRENVPEGQALTLPYGSGLF